MEPRIKYFQTAPEGVDILVKLETYIKQSGLEPSLVELIKLRSSQINGCAYCIDMHTKDARSHGETEQRLYGLNAWREAPFYSERERAALDWAESITLISQNHISDVLYDQTRAHFSEKELVDLTLAVIAINAWNRLAISFHTPAGSYQPNHPITKNNPL
jgi:AhpD family alkylhydroperoxidase